MELTIAIVKRANAALKPLACECLDVVGRPFKRCPVCEGKGGFKGCPTCLGAGMQPDASQQVRICRECTGKGILVHDWSAEVRLKVARGRRERAAQATARTGATR